MTNNPYIGRVGAVLANEIALLAPLDVFSEFRIFGGSPMAFDGEIPLVHAVIRISLNGIGATNRGEKFFGDFKAVHRIVGLRRADHPSVLVNLGHVVLMEQLLLGLLPSVARFADTDDRAIAEGFPPFEGIQQELAGYLTVNEKGNERFRLERLSFAGDSPACEKVSDNFHCEQYNLSLSVCQVSLH